jgi:hypothetical protein
VLWPEDEVGAVPPPNEVELESSWPLVESELTLVLEPEDTDAAELGVALAVVWPAALDSMNRARPQVAATTPPIATRRVVATRRMIASRRRAALRRSCSRRSGSGPLGLSVMTKA